MNLPSPENLTAYLDTLLGTEYRDALRSLAKPVDPRKLRECSPLPWDTTPFPSEVEL